MAIVSSRRRRATVYDLPEIIGWGSLAAAFYVAVCWLIPSIVALFFNWGFGFGFGWYLPLLSAVVVIVAGIGVLTFFLVCKSE